jgi:hypothetical protein
VIDLSFFEKAKGHQFLISGALLVHLLQYSVKSADQQKYDSSGIIGALMKEFFFVIIIIF